MLIRRIARPMLATTFITRGVEALRSPKPAADAARPTLEGLAKLPDPVGPNIPTNAETVARITAGIQIGAGLLLASGRLPRLSSAALAVSVVPGSLGSHSFWNESDPERKASERRALFADVGLIGGLIIAAVDTEGKPSLGWRGRRAARKLGETVTNALPLPTGSTGGAIIDSELVDRIGDGLQSGLHVARERGAELADVAYERGTELADVARERAPKIAKAARKRGAELAEITQDRSVELADLAQKRSAKLVEAARDRAPELASAALDRGSEIADAARDRGLELAELAQDRGSDFAKVARKETKRARKEVDKARKELERNTKQFSR